MHVLAQISVQSETTAVPPGHRELRPFGFEKITSAKAVYSLKSTNTIVTEYTIVAEYTLHPEAQTDIMIDASAVSACELQHMSEQHPPCCQTVQATACTLPP